MASKKLSGEDMKLRKNKGIDEAFIDVSKVSPFLAARATKLSGPKEKSKKKSLTSTKLVSSDELKESEQNSEKEISNIAMSKNFESPSEKEANKESDNEVNKNENSNPSASLLLEDAKILSNELPKWKTASGSFEKESWIILPKDADSSNTTPLKKNSTENSAKSGAVQNKEPENSKSSTEKKLPRESKNISTEFEAVQNKEPENSKSPTEKKLPTESKSVSTKRKIVESSEEEQKKQKVTETDVMRLAIDPESYGITSFVSEKPSSFETKCVFDVQDELEEVPKFSETPCEKIIGIIGCGPMAQEIITILIRHEFTIKVWNRTLGKYGGLPSSVEICKSPADLIEKCDFVATCVADEEAVLQIVFGKNGILEGLSHSCTSATKKSYIEMSSIKSDVIARISEEITGKGGLFLDGQIQGTKVAIRFGSGVVVTSGDRSLFEAARPFFAAFCHCVFYLNATAGTASNASTIVTSIQGMVFTSLAEVMAAISAADIPSTHFTQLLNSTMEMPVIHAVAQMMAKKAESDENIDDDDLPVMMTLGHLLKNLNNALELGFKFSMPSIYASTAAEVYKTAIRKFSRSHDVSVLRKRTPSPHEI